MRRATRDHEAIRAWAEAVRVSPPVSKAPRCYAWPSTSYRPTGTRSPGTNSSRFSIGALSSCSMRTAPADRICKLTRDIPQRPLRLMP